MRQSSGRRLCRLPPAHTPNSRTDGTATALRVDAAERGAYFTLRRHRAPALERTYDRRLRRPYDTRPVRTHSASAPEGLTVRHQLFRALRQRHTRNLSAALVAARRGLTLMKPSPMPSIQLSFAIAIPSWVGRRLPGSRMPGSLR